MTIRLGMSIDDLLVWRMFCVDGRLLLLKVRLIEIGKGNNHLVTSHIALPIFLVTFMTSYGRERIWCQITRSCRLTVSCKRIKECMKRFKARITNLCCNEWGVNSGDARNSFHQQHRHRQPSPDRLPHRHSRGDLVIPLRWFLLH
jgi:hypothetical protein